MEFIAILCSCSPMVISVSHPQTYGSEGSYRAIRGQFQKLNKLSFRSFVLVIFMHFNLLSGRNLSKAMEFAQVYLEQDIQTSVLTLKCGEILYFLLFIQSSYMLIVKAWLD